MRILLLLFLSNLFALALNGQTTSDIVSSEIERYQANNVHFRIKQNVYYVSPYDSALVVGSSHRQLDSLFALPDPNFSVVDVNVFSDGYHIRYQSLGILVVGDEEEKIQIGYADSVITHCKGSGLLTDSNKTFFIGQDMKYEKQIETIKSASNQYTVVYSKGKVFLDLDSHVIYVLNFALIDDVLVTAVAQFTLLSDKPNSKLPYHLDDYFKGEPSGKNLKERYQHFKYTECEN